MSTAIILASSILPPFIVPPVEPKPSVSRSDEATEARRQRGLMIAALCRITQKNGIWTVPSQTGNGSYRVSLDPKKTAVPMCTCDDFAKRGEKCKHVFSVEFVLSREQGDTSTETVDVETITQSGGRPPTLAPKPTYKQAWPAYNAAQIHEKIKFQVLLHDLCQGIEEPQQEMGRPRVSFRDVVFSAAFKVYSTMSGRRFMSDLRDAHAKGYVSQATHYNTISKYLEISGLTPILRNLIAESARPLSAVEVDFAIDSSGFSTSRFVRWYDHKYGKPMAKYDWVKVSLMCGVKTNVVTAVEIDEKKGGDSPQFVPLFKATVKHFAVREASADAAYLSYENAELVASHGGTPFILPKANTTAAKGGMLEKMFHYYQFRCDEFLGHYHKRSNAESTFSMIKAKFGDSLRSKTDTAMINEALCKILCHNLCCLIQSHYELGVVATFWGEESEPMPTPAPIATLDVTPVAVDDPMMAWAWI